MQRVFINWASSILFLHWKQYRTEDKKHATGIGEKGHKNGMSRHLTLLKIDIIFQETIEMLDDTASFKIRAKAPNLQSNNRTI